MTPELLARRPALLLAAAGLPQIRYHALRHTAATLLLLDGTTLFDVSRVLGHSEISTTSDIYGHLLPEMTAAEYAAWRLLVDTPGGTWGRQARRADERRPACLN